MIETDVLVIGAGPAGSSAAKHAALGGANVILLDKKSEIGTPKRCAEGVYQTGLATLGIEINDNWVAQKINGGVIHSPDGSSLILDQEVLPEYGYILERKVFDKYMAMDAGREGAEIMIKTLAKSYKRDGDSVIVSCERMGESFEIKTKIIIGSDGPESHVARDLGLIDSINPLDMMSGVQFEMCGVELERTDLVNMYFGEFANGGYAWIFPKGADIANVGIAVNGQNSDKSPYEYLVDFVNRCPATKNAQAIELNLGGDPVGGMVKSIYGDNLMICGDAAGQVNPVTGGGIISGMVGGMCAGKVAALAISDADYSKDRLKQYETDFKDISKNLIDKLVVGRELMLSLSDKDYNKLIGAFSDFDIKNASNSEIIKRFFKVSPRVSLKFTKLFKILF